MVNEIIQPGSVVSFLGQKCLSPSRGLSYLPDEILCGDVMSEILRTRALKYVFGLKVKKNLPYWRFARALR